MKRKIGIICLTCMIAFSGCNQKMPDMTEEQSAIVTEYASSLLLKYNKNYESNLVDVSENNLETEKEEETKDHSSTTEEILPEEETKDPVIEDTETPASTIEEVCGLDAVSFSYMNCIITDSYSGGDEGEVIVSYDAADGRSLVVLEFDVKNISDKDFMLNMLEVNPTFMIQVANETHKVQTTMLMNDMTTYKGTLAPGETIRLSLTSEFPKESIQQNSQIVLLVRKDLTNATISLN